MNEISVKTDGVESDVFGIGRADFLGIAFEKSGVFGDAHFAVIHIGVSIYCRVSSSSRGNKMQCPVMRRKIIDQSFVGSF